MKYKLLLGLMVMSQFVFAIDGDSKDLEYYDSIRANFSHGSGGNGCGPCGLAYQAAYNDGNEKAAKHFLKQYIKEHGKKVEYGVHLYSEDKIEEYLPKQTSFKTKKSHVAEFTETERFHKRDEFKDSWETPSAKYTFIRNIEEEIIRRVKIEEVMRVRKKK